MTRLELTKLYMSKMNCMIGSMVTVSRDNKTINKKKHSINVFDFINKSILDDIIKFRNKKSDILLSLFRFDD